MSDLLQAAYPVRAAVDAEAFSDALKNVALILKRSAIPILEEASVRFSGGRCILTATDMTTWMMAEIPAQGDDFSFVFVRTKSVERACRCFKGSLTMELTAAASFESVWQPAGGVSVRKAQALCNGWNHNDYFSYG